MWVSLMRWLWIIFCNASYPPFFRWWAGEWQKCSTTCGPTGQKKRTVLCIQTVGSDEQALAVTECQHLLKPKTHLSCNRDVLCPSDWTVSNWTEVNSCLNICFLFFIFSKWPIIIKGRPMICFFFPYFLTSLHKRKKLHCLLADDLNKCWPQQV